MKLAEAQALFWQAVRATRAPRDLEEHYVSRGALDATARMQIYRRAYWARHEKALQESYPLLLERAGARTFRRLVAGYIESRPSRVYQIERAGEAFASYVAASPLLGTEALALGELARLEWARVHALLANDARRRLEPRDLAVEALAERALGTLPSLSLVRVDGSAIAVWRGARGTLEHHLAADEARALEHALAGRTLATICAELDEAARAETLIAAWLTRGWLVDLT